jgi:hypothetical protein
MSNNSDKNTVTNEKNIYFLHKTCTVMAWLILLWLILLLSSWNLCLHSTPVLDFINSRYSGTSRQMGQHPLSCPQSQWPCTWPQFRYTYGCCLSSVVLSLTLGDNLRGITRVFSPTGHWGRPAFNSSTSVSKWCLVWKTQISQFHLSLFHTVQYHHHEHTLYNSITGPSEHRTCS